MGYKSTTPLDRRVSESSRIRAKYPDRVPVIVERANNKTEMPDIDKVRCAQRTWFLAARVGARRRDASGPHRPTLTGLVRFRPVEGQVPCAVRPHSRPVRLRSESVLAPESVDLALSTYARAFRSASGSRSRPTRRSSSSSTTACRQPQCYYESFTPLTPTPATASSTCASEWSFQRAC